MLPGTVHVSTAGSRQWLRAAWCATQQVPGSGCQLCTSRQKVGTEQQAWLHQWLIVWQAIVLDGHNRCLVQAQPQCSNAPSLPADMARQGSCLVTGRHLPHQLVAGILPNPARCCAVRRMAAVWLGSEHACFADGRHVDEGAAAVSITLHCLIKSLTTGRVHLQGKGSMAFATGTDADMATQADFQHLCCMLL